MYMPFFEMLAMVATLSISLCLLTYLINRVTFYFSYNKLKKCIDAGELSSFSADFYTGSLSIISLSKKKSFYLPRLLTNQTILFSSAIVGFWNILKGIFIFFSITLLTHKESVVSLSIITLVSLLSYNIYKIIEFSGHEKTLVNSLYDDDPDALFLIIDGMVFPFPGSECPTPSFSKYASSALVKLAYLCQAKKVLLRIIIESKFNGDVARDALNHYCDILDSSPLFCIKEDWSPDLKSYFLQHG